MKKLIFLLLIPIISFAQDISLSSVDFSPLVISENTVGFKLNFATTRGVSLDAGQDGAQKIFMQKVGADPFTIEVQTKTRRSRGAWR